MLPATGTTQFTTSKACFHFCSRAGHRVNCRILWSRSSRWGDRARIWTGDGNKGCSWTHLRHIGSLLVLAMLRHDGSLSQHMLPQYMLFLFPAPEGGSAQLVTPPFWQLFDHLCRGFFCMILWQPAATVETLQFGPMLQRYEYIGLAAQYGPRGNLNASRSNRLLPTSSYMLSTSDIRVRTQYSYYYWATVSHKMTG